MSIVSGEMPLCTRCKMDKPVSRFFVRKSGKKQGEVRMPCRNCAIIDQRNFREKKGRAWMSWLMMKDRCYGKDHHSGYTQRSYRDAGITVCERWRNSFQNFLEDMGQPPAGMTLDRFPNKYGNYEPSNCRWASRAQQSRNTRSNKLSEGAVKFIREMEWRYCTQEQIGKMFGVDDSVISRVLNRKVW
jgi:hypothetical protein